ncbi:MAG: pilus assembly PilX N-terminal domain-containing protein [Patescibacteria group bacterium]
MKKCTGFSEQCRGAEEANSVHNSRYLKSQRGFTLLLAVLIGSILIAIGSAIFNIVSKQIILSSSGRESQFAFFAADTGIECALYWDVKQSAFATTSPLTQVACGGGLADVTRTPGGTALRPTYTSVFSFPLDGGVTNPCVIVTVVKTFYPTETVVASQGYNTCVTTNPLRLERAIRVQY